MTRKLNKIQRTVIQEIKHLDRRGEALNISSVKRNYPDLIKTTFFWGWKRAVEDAGLDYSKIKVQLEPYVRCAICGKHQRNLFNHVIRYHKISVPDYRIDYPESSIF